MARPGPLIDARAGVVAALMRREGVVRSEAGYATRVLAADLSRSTETVSSLLKLMESDGQVLRDVNAATRKTFEIVLGDVPPAMMQRARELLEADAPELESDSANAVEEQIWQEAHAAGPPDEDTPAPDAAAVADAILRRVTSLLDFDVSDLVSRAAHDVTLADRDEARDRLAITLEENARLRTRLRDVQDEIVAVRSERDRLRHDLHQVEDNLKTMTRNNNGVISDEVHKAIDRFMRETPKGGHGG